MSAQTNCESCFNFVYDDDFGCEVCTASLDEDEFLQFAGRTDVSCPFYQYNDEYINVRKQN